MIEPRILIQQDLERHQLTYSYADSTRLIDPAIEAQVQRVWDAKMIESKQISQNLYNGLSYRLNDIELTDDALQLEVSELEFKVRFGLTKIPAYYELDEMYYRKGCFVGCTFITSDGWYVLVRLSGKSQNDNTIDNIGGIVELDNGHRGCDIFNSLYKEIEEEVSVFESEITSMYLQAVYLGCYTNVGFHFYVQTALTRAEIMDRSQHNQDGDILEPLFFEKTEYKEFLMNHSPNKQLQATLL